MGKKEQQRRKGDGEAGKKETKMTEREVKLIYSGLTFSLYD